MIRKNYYKRITESIVKAYHDNNLDSAMGSQEENMGKKIVAIITADPDQDLEWDHEYQPFGRTSLTQDDEDEAYAYEFGDDECEGEDCEHEGECEGDECDEPVIGGGFEDEFEYEDEDDAEGLASIKNVLMDIRDELSHLHAGDDDDSWEADDENPMFGGSEESDDEWSDDEEDDGEAALEAPESDWSDDEESDDEEYDEEEDFEAPADEDDFDVQEQEESTDDEIAVFDCLDN